MELLPRKSFNIQASSHIDALRNFETSILFPGRGFESWRGKSVQGVKCPNRLKVHRSLLVQCVQEMEAQEALTDTHLEFVPCEFSKLVDCVAANSSFHERYPRSSHQAVATLRLTRRCQKVRNKVILSEARCETAAQARGRGLRCGVPTLSVENGATTYAAAHRKKLPNVTF